MRFGGRTAHWRGRFSRGLETNKKKDTKNLKLTTLGLVTRNEKSITTTSDDLVLLVWFGGLVVWFDCMGGF